MLDVRRYRLHCRIEKALLVPNPRAAAKLNQDVGIDFRQIELAVKRELDRDERGRKILAKNPVVRQSPTVPDWVAIRRYCPHSATRPLATNADRLYHHL